MGELTACSGPPREEEPHQADRREGQQAHRHLQQDAGRIEGQMKGLSEMSADPAPEAQRQMEMEQKALKAVYAQAQASLQRLQHEEATLAQEISIEQGRWTDLNRGLEDLERSLIRR